MTIRQLLVPVANIGTSMGIYMVMFGISRLDRFGQVGCFSLVDLSCSRLLRCSWNSYFYKSKKALESGKLSLEKRPEGSQVLTAAATYLATANIGLATAISLRAGLLGQGINPRGYMRAILCYIVVQQNCTYVYNYRYLITTSKKTMLTNGWGFSNHAVFVCDFSIVSDSISNETLQISFGRSQNRLGYSLIGW